MSDERLGPGRPPNMTTVRHAQFHHNNFFTTRPEAMRDWYCMVLGMEVVFESPFGTWLTNDRANHRLALTPAPGLIEDVDKRYHARLHHQAYEYETFSDLNDTYLRLAAESVIPAACLDHGMTFSYYYEDPDGNYVELQSDNFGDWERSRKWMHESEEFAANPVGAFVDPRKVAEAYAGGTSFGDIRTGVWETDDYRPEVFPDLGAPPPREGDPALPVKW